MRRVGRQRRCLLAAALALAVTGPGAALGQPAEPPVEASSLPLIRFPDDPPLPGQALIVDDMDDPSRWTAHPADGVALTLGRDAGARDGSLRLDFRFAGGGWAIARRTLDLELPDNWVFTLRVRGAAPPEHLEFKLIDQTGENVWWHVKRDFAFPDEWRTITIRKRQVSFAWGPAGGGEPRRVAAVELAITAGSGGQGTVWFDDLELRALPPAGATPPAPVASASSCRRGRGPARVLDHDATTAWEPRRDDGAPWLALDLGEPREFGGLTLAWAPGRHAADYALEGTLDGATWDTLAVVSGGNGGRDHLYLPDGEALRLRLRPRRPPGAAAPALAALILQPLEWSASREAFFAAIAQEHPRGTFPRGMSGEQVYWTVVGPDADPREGLLSEDGALETGRRRFTIEPFLIVDGRLVTWADQENRQDLDGDARVPRVTWTDPDVGFEVTASALGPASGAAAILASYRVSNPARVRREIALVLAARPFQVNPPAQFLATPGGTAPIRTLAREAVGLRVNGELAVALPTPPDAFGAATFAGGDIVADWLRAGALPPAQAVDDRFGAASGAALYRLVLAPGESRSLVVIVPLDPADESATRALAAAAGDDPVGWARRETARARASSWRGEDRSCTLDLPSAAGRLARTVLAQHDCILVNRAGPAIQPGSRSYARSWIRDGALTSSALLRLRHPEPVREFIEWYAPHQYPSGKIPCVVDERGADPVPEHDSSGQFIFLVAEYWRYTHDRPLAERMWPRVRAAVAYLDSLRRTRTTDEWRAPARAEFYGILPPSISHEGYSAKPMHSYWDDFFALRGFADAAFLARELGRAGEAARLQALHDEFAVDLGASVRAAMARHGIDYVPGCADLGDFDATSTTIALGPTSAAAVLPREAIARTFERYWDNFQRRRAGEPWEAFTPYELRNVGAFVRLGWRERAHELLDWFYGWQRPEGWLQWAEVCWRDERRPRFLGDLPHTWVGSDFIRSALDMLLYVRDADQAVVIGAGVLPQWLQPGSEVRVDLPTPWGSVAYRMWKEADRFLVRVEAGMPPGGLVLQPPLPGPPRGVTCDGAPLPLSAAGEIVVRTSPAEVVITP